MDLFGSIPAVMRDGSINIRRYWKHFGPMAQIFEEEAKGEKYLELHSWGARTDDGSAWGIEIKKRRVTLPFSLIRRHDWLRGELIICGVGENHLEIWGKEAHEMYHGGNKSPSILMSREEKEQRYKEIIKEQKEGRGVIE